MTESPDPDQEMVEEAIEALKVQGIEVAVATVKAYCLGQKRGVDKTRAMKQELEAE